MRLPPGLSRLVEDRLSGQPAALATHRRLEGLAAIAAPDPETGWERLRVQLEDRPFGLLQRLSMWARRPVIGFVAASIVGTGGAYAADLGPVRAGADRIRAGLERVLSGGDADERQNGNRSGSGDPERGQVEAPIGTSGRPGEGQGASGRGEERKDGDEHQPGVRDEFEDDDDTDREDRADDHENESDDETDEPDEAEDRPLGDEDDETEEPDEVEDGHVDDEVDEPDDEPDDPDDEPDRPDSGDLDDEIEVDTDD